MDTFAPQECTLPTQATRRKLEKSAAASFEGITIEFKANQKKRELSPVNDLLDKNEVCTQINSVLQRNIVAFSVFQPIERERESKTNTTNNFIVIISL